MKSPLDKPSLKSGKLIAVVGPTASGKSALAMDLASEYDGEIICADSRTIYKGFDIGTAKPTKEDQAKVPHHLLDVCEAGEIFSVAQFKKLATQAIKDIWARGKVAIMVGGSGMYIDSVLFDYQFRVASSTDDLSGEPLTTIQAMVRRRYPDEYPRIDSQNRLRLEQILSRGIAGSEDRKSLSYDCLIIGIYKDRLTLKGNIASRVEIMLNNGFVQEVKALIESYGLECPQLSIIGYRHTRDYLAGQIDLDELKLRFIRDDAALAKRQITWFQRNPAVHWIEDNEEAGRLATIYLGN